MVGLHATIAAVLSFATVTSSPQPAVPVAGALSSIAVSPSGAVLTIAAPSGSVVITVPPGAKIRQRAIGGDWESASLADIKIGEPVHVVADSSGRIVEVDAEYDLVDTRAVIMQDGYIVGTDGVAYKLVAAASAVGSVPLGAYVELRTDPSSGNAFEASVSTHPFAQAATAPAVAVTFQVRVPVNTPPDATVYLATNAQNWTANAIRLSPQPGNVWTATIPLAGGTILQYKYTRGSWATGERDASGSDIQNRTLTVARSGAAQSVHDVVARWADLPS
ncbi:MAG TPA: CBM20 domain-containing protein [Candidatus Eremiobacteraceae bacterium]|nr:CBM20 domain-containing protein [Candidatus Eremiobacteraceae bacterium]